MALKDWLRKLLGRKEPPKAWKNDFLKALEEEDADALFTILKAEAKRGNTEAMATMASLHSTGRGGIQQSDAEAALWYRQAAVRGHIDSQALLGLALATGGGTAVNYDEAAYWLYQAAKMGHPEALDWLADLMFQVPAVIGTHFSSEDVAKLLKARGLNEMIQHARRKDPNDGT